MNKKGINLILEALIIFIILLLLLLFVGRPILDKIRGGTISIAEMGMCEKGTAGTYSMCSNMTCGGTVSGLGEVKGGCPSARLKDMFNIKKIDPVSYTHCCIADHCYDIIDGTKSREKVCYNPAKCPAGAKTGNETDCVGYANDANPSNGYCCKLG